MNNLEIPFVSEHNIFRQMINRCHNPNAPNYKYYGLRGIKVCDLWRNDFWAFYNHVGPRPSSNYSLGRIDNNGDYEPGNVKWMTKGEQANNKTNTVYVEYKGELLTVSQLAKRTNINLTTLLGRVRAGDTGEDLVRPPRKTIMFEGEELSIKEIANRLGVSYTDINNWLYRGFSIDEIVYRAYQMKLNKR